MIPLALLSTYVCIGTSLIFRHFRIGRTARAGRAGVAITLLETKQLKAFKNMLSQAKKSTSLNDEKITVTNNDVREYEQALEKIKNNKS